jgi:hypothetical protein
MGETSKYQLQTFWIENYGLRTTNIDLCLWKERIQSQIAVIVTKVFLQDFP